MTLVIVCVFGGAVLGLLTNRWWRHLTIEDDREGPSPDEVLTPVTTFAALFIAIVLAGASGTYQRAGDAAANEANIVDNMFEATSYLKDASIQTALQVSLVCYARAVRGPGWDAMCGGRELAGARQDRPSTWTGTGDHGLRTSFHKLRTDDPMFERLVDLDVERGDSRRDRLALAEPSVPGIISTFMLILVSLSLVMLGYFIPRTQNTAHRVAVLATGVVLVLSLALVRNLDRPFKGILKIAPTAMSITADDIGEDFAEAHPTYQLPCTQRGAPLG